LTSIEIIKGGTGKMNQVKIITTQNPDDPTKLDVKTDPEIVLVSLAQEDNDVSWVSTDGHPFSISFTAGNPFTLTTAGSDPYNSELHQQDDSQLLMTTLLNEALLPGDDLVHQDFPYTLTVTELDTGAVGTLTSFARGRRRGWPRQ